MTRTIVGVKPQPRRATGEPKLRDDVPCRVCGRPVSTGWTSTTPRGATRCLICETAALLEGGNER